MQTEYNIKIEKINWYVYNMAIETKVGRSFFS